MPENPRSGLAVLLPSFKYIILSTTLKLLALSVLTLPEIIRVLSICNVPVTRTSPEIVPPVELYLPFELLYAAWDKVNAVFALSNDAVAVEYAVFTCDIAWFAVLKAAGTAAAEAFAEEYAPLATPNAIDNVFAVVFADVYVVSIWLLRLLKLLSTWMFDSGEFAIATPLNLTSVFPPDCLNVIVAILVYLNIPIYGNSIRCLFCNYWERYSWKHDSTICGSTIKYTSLC